MLVTLVCWKNTYCDSFQGTASRWFSRSFAWYFTKRDQIRRNAEKRTALACGNANSALFRSTSSVKCQENMCISTGCFTNPGIFLQNIYQNMPTSGRYQEVKLRKLQHWKFQIWKSPEFLGGGKLTSSINERDFSRSLHAEFLRSLDHKSKASNLQNFLRHQYGFRIPTPVAC